jgi:hypothetical protein
MKERWTKGGIEKDRKKGWKRERDQSSGSLKEKGR